MPNDTIAIQVKNLGRLPQQEVTRSINGIVALESNAILREGKPCELFNEVARRAYLPHGGFVDYAMPAWRSDEVARIASALGMTEEKVRAELQERAIRLAYPC